MTSPARYICLIGFMGSGKSAVASALAAHHAVTVLESDHAIESATQTPIPEIFARQGEPYFRELETNFLRSLPTPSKPAVLSTGGGMPITPENGPLLKAKSTIYFIDVPFDTIWTRISGSDRPKVAELDRDALETLYTNRLARYRALADHIVPAETMTPLEISEWIWKNYSNVSLDTPLPMTTSEPTSEPFSEPVVAAISDTASIRVPIHLNQSFDTSITIGANILKDVGPMIVNANVGRKCLIFSNPQVRSLYGDVVVNSCREAGLDADFIDVPQGEKFKSFEMAGRLLDYILSNRLERKDTIIALGGGVIGDLGGFVASIYLRGINFVQIPTSLLAQVDASVGGKTGVNHSKGKNLIGTFYQPIMTIIDTQTIRSLPQREIRCGLAEIVKYGVIQKPELFDYLEQNASLLKGERYTKDPATWIYLTTESVKCKAGIVEKDEREAGLREILNFGHTIGHGIEAAFEYQRYSHGEAVAFGMKAACLIAVKMNLLPEATSQRIITLMDNLGFFLQLSPIPVDRILKAMLTDKKIRNGALRFVLPTEIGSVVTTDAVPETLVKEVIQALME